MQFPSSLVIALGLIAKIQARPAEDREIVVAHFTMHGGPASYELFVPTDGTVISTGTDLSISIIDTPNYDAISLCTFNTPGPKALVGSVTPQGLKQITVGPPQPILSVSCRAK
ncbi:hypothetical protein F5B17DRAFT_409017 [Nemania serpens]|nr:hypothetical protein F5B17DRAFT_409017 [Nemania serpens]